jgi:hypothetical protein
MDKVGDTFTALPFSISFGSLKAGSSSSSSHDVSGCRSSSPQFTILHCIKCGASLVVYSDTSKLVLIFPWHTAIECLGSALSVYFWWCNLELQVCSKSVTFNEP